MGSQIEHKVRYLENLPPAQKNSILVYDKKLSSKFKKWIQSWPCSIAVNSGESLKTFAAFEKLACEVHAQNKWGRQVTLCAFGGGSVTDVVGFLASVYLRGVNWASVPSTWLAAVDAAHGGKTALNLGGYKNQIGSFYQAEKVILSRKALCKAPLDGVSELVKAAFLDGEELYENLWDEPAIDESVFWQLLPKAVDFKRSICQTDLKEELGLRSILNLGHTWGHVLEKTLKISHAQAVALGMCFCLNWSRKLNFLSQQDFEQMEWILQVHTDLKLPLNWSLNKKEVQKALLSDKKIKNQKINFIFIKKPGLVISKPVSVEGVLQEAVRQGWV